MKPLRLLAFFTLLISAFIPAASVSAHQPIWGDEGGITRVPNLVTSYAYYRDLLADEVHVYTFEGKTGQEFRAGMQIPAIKGLEDYAVTIAIMGPGLPEANHDQLPPEHPEGLGALIVPSFNSEDFFEPFTQTLYWGRQSIQSSLPADGTYYILVWQSEGVAGKYVMDTGYAENFGVEAIFLMPVWWVRVHLFFGHGVYLLAGAVVILTAGGFFILRRRRKK
jgi:LPXTG-motif cell wall-anchored protein